MSAGRARHRRVGMGSIKSALTQGTRRMIVTNRQPRAITALKPRFALLQGEDTTNPSSVKRAASRWTSQTAAPSSGPSGLRLANASASQRIAIPSNVELRRFSFITKHIGSVRRHWPASSLVQVARVKQSSASGYRSGKLATRDSSDIHNNPGLSHSTQNGLQQVTRSPSPAKEVHFFARVSAPGPFSIGSPAARPCPNA